MKTVGIYLGGTPSDGGTYQNALSLVSALAALPRDKYWVIGYLRGSAWPQVLEEFDSITRRPARAQSIASRAVTKLLRELPVSLDVRKRVGSLVVPFGRQLAHDKVDVCLYPNFEHYAWELATPSIGAIHDLMHRYEPHFPEVAEDGIPARRDRMFSRMRTGATAVLVDSNVGREHVVESYGEKGADLYVLPYVAPDYIHAAAEVPNGTALDGWASEMGLPEKYLLYPAQFWMHKNHARLLEAFARLRDRHSDARLVLVGSEKNGSTTVAREIERLDLSGSVHLLGYVSNEQLVYLYRHARALVMTTFFGPTNIPPLEAFALGCPVAVSGIYGVPEQVGDAALLFDPRSTDEIFEACVRLWEDDELVETLRARGYVRASAWGPAQHAACLRQILDAVLEAGGR